jgi:ricin-type beta-trefoil lectin protein
MHRGATRLISRLAVSTAAAALCLTNWAPHASAASPFVTLHTRLVNLCLGVSAGNMTNGTPIISYTCNGHPDQQWEHIDPDEFGYGPWRNMADTNKCLALAGNSTSPGAKMVIWDCDGTPGQLWNSAPGGLPGSEGLHIWNWETGAAMALELDPGCWPYLGCDMQQADYTGYARQSWVLS